MKSEADSPKSTDDKKEANANIIRFDLCLAASFPTDAPRELWLDHAIVHETSESYQGAVIRSRYQYVNAFQADENY